jgi:hypothetical protein
MITGGYSEQLLVSQAPFGKTCRITGGFRNNFHGQRRLSEQLLDSQAACGTISGSQVAFGQFSGSQAAFETIFKITGCIWNNFQVQQAAFGKTFRITGGFRNHF